MATPKFGVYFWVTWLSGILSGEDRCRWAAWFKSRYAFEKVVDDDFDSAGYNTLHKELLNRRVKELIAEGWAVTTERQNQFKLKGKVATIGGKPDIVAIKDNVVLISDPKTGARMNKHVWQVMIYMAVWPKVHKELAGMEIVGEVYYGNGAPAHISAADLSPENAQRIWAQVNESAFEIPPEKEPSEVECGFCNIPKNECPQRMAVVTAIGETNEF